MDFSKNPLVKWLQNIYQYLLSHKKEFIVGVSIFILLIIFLVGYSFYKSSLQQKAHESFVKALKIYEAKVVGENEKDELDPSFEFFTSDNEKWTKVEKVFGQSFEENKNSGIAPIFLAYQSEALFNLNKLDESIKVLQKAVNLMSKSAVKTYYQVKLALMKIDSSDEKLQNDGLDFLKQLAVEDKNPAHAMILYRLGQYYWLDKNYDEARNYWNQLILKYGKGKENASWWAELASPKLKLISAN